MDKSIKKRATILKFLSKEDYIAYIQNNPEEALALYNSMHIKYSEFFRNSLTFSLLEKIILPRLLDKQKSSRKKEIRIWSAACASGQEAYSAAILLDEAQKLTNPNFRYRIFATDISAEALDAGKKGIYNISDISGITMKRIETYFNLTGDKYVINPQIKENVDFSIFNLLSTESTSPAASIFGSFDIIFCGNVLFYYKPEYQKIILDKIKNNLAPGGYIITGEAEREILISNKYKELFVYSSIFQPQSAK